MSTLRQATVSIVEYRPTLASESRVIPIGVLVAVRDGRKGGFALTGPTQLADADLSRMDRLSAELLARPIEYFRPLVDKEFRKGEQPLTVLQTLSEENNSSLSVSDPRELQVNIRLDEGADLADVAFHISVHALAELRAGRDPFSLKITGRSGALLRETLQDAGNIEPFIADWANGRERATWTPRAARVA